MDKQVKHEPLWLDMVPEQPFPVLDRDIRVDVVVVGGGITGLTAAHQLKKAGMTVAVVEQHAVAGGETGHTTAHLTQAFDTGLTKLTRAFGDDGAREIWDAGAVAIRHIEETCEREHIACHFERVPGYYFAASGDDRAKIEEEARLARRLGLVADVVDEHPFPAMKFGAMRLANQGQFNPRMYLLPLARLIPGEGSHVFEHTHVSAYHPGSPARVEAGGFTITADHLIVATHQPTQSKLFVSRVAAYQTYAVAARVPRGAFPHVLAWDTAEPYHYWRMERFDDHDLVIIGGEDHRTGQEDDTEAPFARLEAYVAEQLGGIKHALTHRWSGQVLEPVDGAPFIGLVPGTRNEYVATGYSGNGMTMGTFAGLLLTQLILEATGSPRTVHPASRLLSPSRIKLAAGAVTFLTENLSYPTYLLKDRLSPAEQADLEGLAVGEGKVVAIAGEKVAASRDAEGQLHAVSAICTHMGCVVHWNGAETTWDCPCHGSRFMPNGEVVSGPAIEGLPPCQASLKPPEKKV